MIYCNLLLLFRHNHSAELLGERARTLSPTSKIALEEMWAELKGGGNSLHWKANMLPLFSIMTLWTHFVCSSERWSVASAEVNVIHTNVPY